MASEPKPAVALAANGAKAVHPEPTTDSTREIAS